MTGVSHDWLVNSTVFTICICPKFWGFVGLWRERKVSGARWSEIVTALRASVSVLSRRGQFGFLLFGLSAVRSPFGC